MIQHGVQQDPVTGLPIFVQIPIPDSSVWGVEFEIVTQPTKAFEIHSSATLVDVELADVNQTGQFYRGLTPAVVDLEFSYLISRNIRLAFDWHYVGQRFTNAALTNRLPDYNYINLGASYRFSDTGFTIGARVLNLTQSEGLEESNPLGDATTSSPNELFFARPLLPRRITIEAKYDF